MNIPTLNMVLLATPKSNIEQSVGRILRQKKEERTVQPMILDIVDTGFNECMGQWKKRKRFYEECGYMLRWQGENTEMDRRHRSDDSEDAPRGVALFVDDEPPVAAPKKTKKSKKASTEAADIISHVTRGNALFVDEED
jgi:hypothetical protein